jgi:hypothetical protein
MIGRPWTFTHFDRGLLLVRGRVDGGAARRWHGRCSRARHPSTTAIGMTQRSTCSARWRSRPTALDEGRHQLVAEYVIAAMVDAHRDAMGEDL